MKNTLGFILIAIILIFGTTGVVHAVSNGGAGSNNGETFTGDTSTLANGFFTFAADETLLIDAFTTDHTGTLGVINLKTETATADVIGFASTNFLTGDVDGVTGVGSIITGNAAGGTGGNTTYAYRATMNGDDNDTNHNYTGYQALNFNNNGGAGTATGLKVGTGYLNAIETLSGSVLNTFGAAQKMTLDANGHSDTAGVIDLNLTTDTANVVGIHIASGLGGDVDGVTGLKSSIIGNTAGGTGGNETIAVLASLLGDDNDTDHYYTAFKAVDFDDGTGTSEATALKIGANYTNALKMDSGDIIFYAYSPNILGEAADDSNGDDLSIAAADGNDTGAVARNGGILKIYGGVKANAGNDGYVHVGQAAGTPDSMTATDDDIYVKGQMEVDGMIYADDDIFTDHWLSQNSNTFIGIDVAGADALSHTTGSEGYNNTGFGYSTLKAITTGYDNTAVGHETLTKITTGYQNTVMGKQSGYENTTGHENSFFGYRAGYKNVDGQNNSFIGILAGENNSSGNYNTFLGNKAGQQNTTGDSNTLIGHYTESANTTGNRNTALGATAGVYQNDGSTPLQTPEDSLYLGSLAKSGSDPAGGEDAITNEIVIGFNATGNGANTVTIGNSSITDTYITGNTVLAGDITSTGTAIDWDLLDNNASALSFDAAGKSGILEIVTLDTAEGVNASGFMNVTGTVTGGTLTDGTLSINSGAITGMASATDGTASWTGSNLSGFGTITSTSTITTTGTTGLVVGDNTDQSLTLVTADTLTADETLAWDQAGSEFDLSDDLHITGDLETTGQLVVGGDLTVNGTTTTINSTTLTVDDKNIVMGSVASPTDTTADGGGMILKGATDKTILWDNANDNWTSNQSWNIATGLDYKINNVSVLNATTLGANIVSSSLTSTGALDSGSITSGFGAIDNGTGNITTGGILRIDVDGTGINAAGSIGFGGVVTDSAIYWNGTNLELDTTAGFDFSISGTPEAVIDAGGIDLVTGDAYEINGVDVLDATTLGTNVVSSSLTSVGTIGTGVWEGTDVGVAHGGTGVSAWTQYGLVYADTTTSLSQVTDTNAGKVLITNAGAAPSFNASPTLTSVLATTFDTNVAAAGTTLAGTTIGTDGTDGNIPFTFDIKGTAGSTYVEIIDDNDAGFLALGDTGNTSGSGSRLSIVDGGADNAAGELVLYEDDGNGSFLWVNTASVLRGNNAAPADDDADGYAIMDLSDGTIGASAQQGSFDDVTLADDLLLADGAVIGITGNEIITFDAAGTVAITGAILQVDVIQDVDDDAMLSFSGTNGIDVVNAFTAGTVASDASITGTSFVIGGNTLDTNEWANLDGLNQTLATTSTPTFAGLTLGATNVLYFDGGTDTYITESGADVLDFYVGALNILKLTEAATDKIEVLGSDLEIDATQKLYLDGGSDTYIHESGADTLDLVAGAVTMLSLVETTADYVETKVGTVYTPSSDQARADDSTITVDNTIVRVAGDGAAAVLDTDPAIEDGVADGQVLILQGTSEANTVQIADAVNTALKGGVAFTLGQNDTMKFLWDSGESLWVEVSRSDN